MSKEISSSPSGKCEGLTEWHSSRFKKYCQFSIFNKKKWYRRQSRQTILGPPALVRKGVVLGKFFAVFSTKFYFLVAQLASRELSIKISSTHTLVGKVGGDVSYKMTFSYQASKRIMRCQIPIFIRKREKWHPFQELSIKIRVLGEGLIGVSFKWYLATKFRRRDGSSK